MKARVNCHQRDDDSYVATEGGKDPGARYHIGVVVVRDCKVTGRTMQSPTSGWGGGQKQKKRTPTVTKNKKEGEKRLLWRAQKGRDRRS